MTNRPAESPNDPSADPIAAEEVPPNPETDPDGRPEHDLDQPADVESGDVAENPTKPEEDAEPGQMPESTNTEVGA